MEIQGKIKSISNEFIFDSGFKKRELVITTEEQYPQHILIELLGDRTDIVDPYKVGDDVKVSINIRGREWVNPKGETKYFNSITGWKIEKLNTDSNMSSGSSSTSQQLPVSSTPTTPIYEDEDNDLPF